MLQRGRNRDPEYATVSPLGTALALVTASGNLIVESVAVLLHIADAIPAVGLTPPAGRTDRDRLHMLLSTMVTAGRAAFRMPWRSERFADTDEGRATVQRMRETRIGGLFGRLAREIRGTGYLIGDRPTVADLYLFVLRPCAAQRAMAREGIALHGPKAGLG